jgi:hypothetical protein
MSAAAMSQFSQAVSGSVPVLAAPAQCPWFPGYTTAPTTPVHALPASAAGIAVPFAQAHRPAAISAAAHLNLVRTRTNRGPPSDIG